MRKGRAGHCGFSLIELVAALAVVAILATVAVPAYQNSIRKARRAEGKTFLHILMMAEERHYAGFHRYTSDVGTKGLALPVVSQPGGHYALSRVEVSSGDQFVRILVSPQGAQVADACGALSLDSTGMLETYAGAADECG